jgi:predicted small lipoprotein YifL
MMQRFRLRPGAAFILVAAVILGSLGGCGRKNPPTLPPGQTDEFQRQYPTSTEPQQGVFN